MFVNEWKFFLFAGGRASFVYYIHTKDEIHTLPLAQVIAYQVNMGF
jgi:hypothetical protein